MHVQHSEISDINQRERGRWQQVDYCVSRQCSLSLKVKCGNVGVEIQSRYAERVAEVVDSLEEDQRDVYVSCKQRGVLSILVQSVAR